jgi:arsenate reductase
MNVLFVCNGNVARSQEAELFFNTFKSDTGSAAKSGGINVKIGKPIDPTVIEVMNEAGYNISSAVRKVADEKLVDEADLIVSLKPKDELPTYIKNHRNVRYWTIADPQHQSTDFHRKVRDSVRNKVENLIMELKV